MLIAFFKYIRRYYLRQIERFTLDPQIQKIAGWERPVFLNARPKAEHLYQKKNDPLVSITTCTWNRGDILVERAVASAQQQTYQNFEMIIVGDHCTDDTAKRIAALNDPRITFINLPQRGPYPKEKSALHCVAGTPGQIKAFQHVKGDWIAHLDDDEIWEPDHLEQLLRHAQDNNCELVWGKAKYEIAPGKWVVEGSPQFWMFDIPHSTVLFRAYLKMFEPHMDSWKLKLGVDRHRFRRMYYCGVRTGFVNKIVTIGPLRPNCTKNWSLAEDRNS